MKKLLIIIALLSTAAPVWAACGTSYLDKLVTTGTAAAVGTTTNPILGQGRFTPPTIAVVNCVGVSLASVTDGGGAYKVKISEINIATGALATTEGGCTSDNVSIISGASGDEILFSNLSCYLTPTKSYGIAVFKANGETDNNHYISLLSKSADNGLAGFRMIWNTNGTLKSMSPSADFGLKLYTAKPVTKGLYTYVVANGKAIITATSCGRGNVTIPDTLGGYPVTVIGRAVFAACDKITSITVPASVTRIEMYGLETASPLTSAHFKGDAPSIYEDGILLLKEGAKVYYCNGAPGYTNPWNGYETTAETCKGSPYTTTISTTTTILVENGYSYTVTDNQSTITAHECPTGAFVIPDTIGIYPTVAIADNVFTGCTGLTSVTIPNSITSIGSTAFAGCTGLASVTLGAGVASIGNNAFLNCTSLTSVTIPASVTSIGISAFSDCTNLYNVHFLGNAPTMGTNVFANHKLGFVVYYITGATGFTIPTWGNYLSVIETVAPQTSAVWDRTTTLTGLSTNHIFEPSLIAPETTHCQYYDNDSVPVWKMWLVDGKSGTYDIYYTESLDGINWHEYTTPVISRHCHHFVIKNGNTYYLYAANDNATQMDLYTSSNGKNWTPSHAGVISKGTPGSWNSNGITNSGGVVVAGILYLFVECYDATGEGRTGLFTSTDFYTFTPYAENPLFINKLGPTVPYKIGNTWWMWMHGNTVGSGGLPTDGYRFSAPALTGPWTQNPNKISLPRITQDDGVGGSGGQIADLFPIEVGGKTYMYYASDNYGGGSHNDLIATIKLAIANMPISQLVQTDEY